MKMKNILYTLIAFILPWILIIAGVIGKIYNAWLYVGSITWFVVALLISLSFYK